MGDPISSTLDELLSAAEYGDVARVESALAIGPDINGMYELRISHR
jgi:hypothetical protein